MQGVPGPEVHEPSVYHVQGLQRQGVRATRSLRARPGAGEPQEVAVNQSRDRRVPRPWNVREQ